MRFTVTSADYGNGITTRPRTVEATSFEDAANKFYNDYKFRQLDKDEDDIPWDFKVTNGDGTKTRFYIVIFD